MTSKLLRSIEKWIPNRNPQGMIGIEFGPEGVAICGISHEAKDDTGHIVFCQFTDELDPEAQSQFIQKTVNNYKCKGWPCSVVLHPSQYQLLLLDAPPDLNVEELREAMKWRVKDLISFDIETCFIDAFRLPDDAYRGRMHMVYTSVCQKDVIQELTKRIAKVGLNIWRIDISELALKNITTSTEENLNSAGLLWLHADTSYINLCQNDHLYLTRKFDSGVNTQQASNQTAMLNDHISSLILEIQRSLDYYESQLGKGSVSKIYTTPIPVAEREREVLELLNQRFDVPFEQINLDDIFSFEEHTDRLVQAKCLNAIGTAAKRQSHYDHTTG